MTETMSGDPLSNGATGFKNVKPVRLFACNALAHIRARAAIL